MAAALTRGEAARLAELEQIVCRGIETFHQVGRALQEIRDRRLHVLAGFATFEEYCQARWGFSRVHGWRLISAAGVVDSLPAGNAPRTERQARELVPLPPAERLRVWQEANYGPTPPTAERVRQLAAKALAGLPPDEQAELVQASERRLLDEGARQVGGERRQERLAQILRLCERVKRLTAGLGGEAEHALNLLGAFVVAVHALSGE